MGFWGKIYKMTLVATSIKNKQLYTEKVVNKDGKQKKKLVYYPRLYVKFLPTGFQLYLPQDGNKFQKQFKDGILSSEIVMSTRSTKSDETAEDGFVIHEFLVFPEKARVPLDDMEIKSDSIQIMDGFTWNFAKVPHMLVAGDTGSGKSFFLFSIISGILKSGADLMVADPKRTDLASLAQTTGLKGKVVYSDDRILKAFTKFYDEMYLRAEEYTEILKNDDGMGDYRDFELKPSFFVFDEFGAFVSKLEWKQQEQLKKQVGEIVMLGRQLGFFLIVAMQRPDADSIGSGARDQFQFRVTLGKMKSAGLTMMFPEADPNDFVNLSKKLKGWGYAQMSPDLPRAFFAPLIPRGFKAKAYFNKLGEQLAENTNTEKTE
ncbi:FtsK/SpoIIIE domain-containing protein [Weissella ceti]|uniref:FtsK/SpoIIIE domain-containing protein n=2 Tax=Weissella ceti TaxID=759620 RepID=A0ABT3E3X1_9LACO|nr:FtsK/SpoIIIE domain-containing protein [Weissella ceti]MCW0953116.1 FtsK/SpoIIIE domain-containing protein [Weissella ceti]